MYDLIEGVDNPYDSKVSLWSRNKQKFGLGDPVPALGIAQSYSVRLAAQTQCPARYLLVENKTLTSIAASEPLLGWGVFDAWGRYLGVGGESMKEPGRGPVDTTQGIVEQVLKSNPKPSPPPEPKPESPSLTHSFHLREELQVEITLPRDLTKAEAERLSLFIQTLPFSF